MDKVPYELYAIFLNRLSDIVYNSSRHGHYIFGHYFLHTNVFVEKSVSLWI